MNIQRWLKRRKRTLEETIPDNPPSIERLEPRVLLSGDPLGTSSLSALAGPVPESVFLASETGGHESEPAGAAVGLFAGAGGGPCAQGRENHLATAQILFVDSSVPDLDVLLRGWSLGDGGATRVVYLDARRDGIEQITEALAGCRDLAAIHIVSHGAGGSLLLGSAVVDARTIEGYAGQLRNWGAALADQGDILLYGCRVAEGDVGTRFLDRLRALTGADIAASDDPTGGAARLGDWDLEVTRGTIETAPAFGASNVGDYEHVLQFTLVVLPDTQKYALDQLQPFFDQTQWIADHAASNNIAFVSHVGDVVESGALYESEWVFADAAMDILDGTSVPYSVLPGNHDYDIPGTHSTIHRFAGLDAGGNPDPTLAGKSFGPERYEGKSWFLGASDDRLNYCQIFTADGQDYLHIALEWEPRPSSVQWAQQQIDARPHLPVILSTHYYIEPTIDGHFLKTYSDDGLNGEELFQTLVYPNPQVFLVLSGHNTEWHRVATNAAGFEVIETMTDYQSRPNGGNGWMQLFTFDPDLNRLSVQTYSPTLDQFETDANSQFAFDFDFSQRFNFLLAPTAALVEPADQGPDDKNPAYDAVLVNAEQSRFRIQLTDVNDGIDDATVTSQAVALTKNGSALAESVDYSFSYDPAADQITLTSIGGDFTDGLYAITFNEGTARIADAAGNELTTGLLTVQIDTSIPHVVTFQQGVGGYTGTVDTDVWGSTPDTEYSTAASIRADAQSGGSAIHGLLRFEDIFGSAPGQIPIGAQITSAQLEFRVADNGNALRLHRMLRGWVETETWNTLGAGIQADGIEAVVTPDATTAEVAVGTLSIDVTASLIAWANDPAGNLGWAILPIGPNGVMLNSSEGTTPPKLTVTFNAASGNNPPTVALENPLTSLAENADTSARIKVADIVVTDDEVGTNVLSLGGADADLFEIDGMELYLKAGSVLDYETNPTLDVAVEVNDPTVGSTPDDTATLAISVTDVNEPPTVALVNAIVTLPENTDTSVRIRVADIVVTDDALGANVLSLAGADADLFEIDGTVLYLKAGTPLNMGTNPVLDVTVEVDDPTVGSVPDAAVALAIQVTEANNAPTVDLTNPVASLPENTDTSARIKVADIVVTDDAVGTNVLSLSGADAALFEIDGTELYLKAGSVLDYETNPTLDVIVEVNDPVVGTDPDDTAVLAISVTDVNEPPTVALENTLTTLAEDTDTSVRIKVADIVITDDALGANVLSLAGADAGLFEIDGTVLYLKAGTILDVETNPVLQVAVELDDPAIGGNPDAVAILAITVGGSTPRTATFQQGVNGYAGTVDTDVQGSTPDTEYSADTSIRADAQSGGYPIHGLLRFEDIFGSAPDQIPAGAQINSAWLEFRVTDNGNALRFHRMLRDWIETETWNSLGAGIQATDIEAVSVPDATTAELIVGTLSIDVTASLIAWSNDPSSNFGWAILPVGPNGVMLNSSESAIPPKLIVTFGGTVVDTTAPVGRLVVPLDQGPNDLDPAANAVSVNTAPPYFQIHLEDVGDGIDDMTVTSQTVVLTRDGILLTEAVDYSFNYDPATDRITLSPISGTFGDGLYQIMLNGGGTIADLAGNPLPATPLTVRIDTSVSLPQTAVFQQGINGYTGTVDTDVQGSTPDTVYGTDASIRADALSGGSAIHGLLRFEDILGSAPGQIPVGAQIISAQLEFRVTDNGNALRLHRMLRGWTETETWNTLGAGIQAADVEAVSTPDATTSEVALGTLSIDVTASLIAWANDPASNLGWAILPIGPNGVMLNSSEGATPPKLTVTFATSAVNNPPTVALENPLTSLAENADTSARIKVADIVVTDDEVGTNVLSLSGADADLFEIDGMELYLKAGSVLDYETNPTLDVTVEVNDPVVGSTPDDTAVLTISVTDVNEPPTVALLNATTTLAEDTDTSVRIKVADIVITDDALGANVLSLTGADAAMFEIDGTVLYLKAGATLDYGTNPVLDVTVEVDDPAIGSNPDAAVALAIQVTEANNAPTVDLTNPVASLPENTDTSARIKVADIVVTDDAVGTNVLSLSGADAALFEIDGTELYLKAGSVLDYETNPTLDVTVEVNDPTVGSTPDDTATLAISVTDVNEPPTVALLNATTTLAEDTDTTAPIKVADIVVTDDALGANVLSLTGADADLFEIDGTVLYLKAGATLDYGTNPVLDVTVEVDDPAIGSNPDAAVALAIQVTEANNAPTVDLTNPVASLPENTDTSARIKVADIVVTDDEVGTNVLSLSGADADLFEIDGMELYLKAGSVLDYETNPTLDVTVEVNDPTVGSTPDDTAVLAISVTDVNEPPTVALLNATTTLAEDTDTTAPIQVADIVVTDDALGANVLSLAGADAGMFEIDGTVLYLKAGATLDYGTNPVLDVTVEVDDPAIGSNPDAAVALAIQVTEANSAPTVDLANPVASLPENTDTSARIKVADIVVTDDEVGTNVLSLSGADADLFEIDGMELYLKAGSVLDYETNPTLDVIVEVNDPTVGSTPDDTATLAISVTPAAGEQTVIFQQGVGGYTDTLDTDIRGDAPNNQYSTSASVRVDGKNVAYPAQALLRFENVFGSAPGQIPVGAQVISAQLELTITDAGSALSLHRMLRGWVETETWNTLGAGIQTDGIEALATPDASTGQVALGTLSIDVTASLIAWANDPSTHFGWAILMAESNAILFGSSEGATPPKLTVTFTASAVNNPPTVTLENTLTTLAEDADTSARIKVADIVVTDDGLGTNVLSLSGTDADLFEIDGTELYLRAGAVLDYETNPQLDVTVAVDDPEVGTSPDGTASLVISISDVPEVTVYYVSQSGAGNGLAPDAPASVADFNAGAGPFGVLDSATIYFLGTITTTINPADSGTAESRVILRGDHPTQPCTIDGAGTLPIGIDVGSDSYISVVGFTVQSTTTAAINVGAAATGTIIENCTIFQTAGRGIAVQSPVTIRGNALTATGGTQGIYSLLGPSGGDVAITDNVFHFNHAGSGLSIDGYGDHIIADNEIHFSAGSATLLNAYAVGGEIGSIVFSGNDIDSSVAPSGPLVSIRYGDWAVTISDNTFDLTSAAFGNDVIQLSDLVGPTVTGNSIRVADDVACVHLDGSGRNAVATITHNTLTHTGGDGNDYLIRVGEEIASSVANTYDGVVITDNLVTGFTPVGNCHAVFVGFNRNAVIARNYVSNAGYGIVVKGTEGTDYTAGGVMYNVIYNCDIGLRIKGVDDVVVVNNTIYAAHALILTGNVGGDESTGVVLKNNIFAGPGGSLLQIGSETDWSTISTADYATNCLCGYSSSDYLRYQGVNYTCAEWMALGYANGSINADPLFTNLATGDLTLASGSPCIDTGTNLGSLYDDALDPLSSWPLFVSTLDQDEYGTGWEIGAYVVWP